MAGRIERKNKDDNVLKKKMKFDKKDGEKISESWKEKMYIYAVKITE